MDVLKLLPYQIELNSIELIRADITCFLVLMGLKLIITAYISFKHNFHYLKGLSFLISVKFGIFNNILLTYHNLLCSKVWYSEYNTNATRELRISNNTDNARANWNQPLSSGTYREFSAHILRRFHKFSHI